MIGRCRTYFTSRSRDFEGTGCAARVGSSEKTIASTSGRRSASVSPKWVKNPKGGSDFARAEVAATVAAPVAAPPSAVAVTEGSTVVAVAVEMVTTLAAVVALVAAATVGTVAITVEDISVTPTPNSRAREVVMVGAVGVAGV